MSNQLVTHAKILSPGSLLFYRYTCDMVSMVVVVVVLFLLNIVATVTATAHLLNNYYELKLT